MLTLRETMSDAASFNKEEVEEFFGTAAMCYKCGMKRAQDPHHIMKRMPPKGNDRKMMSSLYNLSPLCRNCHDKGDLHRNPGPLLRKTRSWLKAAQYVDNKNDKKFLDTFSHYYIPPNKDLPSRKSVSFRGIQSPKLSSWKRR